MTQCHKCTELEARIKRLRQALRDCGLDLMTIMHLEVSPGATRERSDDNSGS